MLSQGQLFDSTRKGEVVVDGAESSKTTLCHKMAYEAISTALQFEYCSGTLANGNMSWDKRNISMCNVHGPVDGVTVTHKQP